MSVYKDWQVPEYNRNELNVHEIRLTGYNQGVLAERKRILNLLRNMTKKPSAAVVKLMLDLEREN
jgi:hypothetical protein